MPQYRIDDHAPEIGEHAWLAPNATVIGRVRLQPRSSVWWGAVLRGDTEWITLGEGSNVQDNAVVHADPGFPVTIGADVTIGHQAMIHGCTIGAGSLIGIGAVILNGARIGARCLVGAGALVTEGKDFPDGSMILGTPARVVRALEPAEIERLAWSARHYVDNARRNGNAVPVEPA